MPDVIANAVQGVGILMQAALHGSIGALVLVVCEFWILYILVRVLYMIWRLMHELWNPRVDAVAPARNPNGQRILIVGDSTARGTGAQSWEETIAGRLRKDFPDVDIYNNAVNAATTKQVLAQLGQTHGQVFNLVFVSSGGNDILHVRSAKQLRQDIRAVLAEALSQSDHRVIVLFYANLSSAPIFPTLIAWYLRRRIAIVHAVYLEACKEFRVPCIELYTEFTDTALDTNYFAQNPNRYFAKDYIHPSGEGYGLWYKRIWREMLANGYSSGLGSTAGFVSPKSEEPQVTQTHSGLASNQ